MAAICKKFPADYLGQSGVFPRRGKNFCRLPAKKVTLYKSHYKISTPPDLPLKFGFMTQEMHRQ